MCSPLSGSNSSTWPVRTSIYLNAIAHHIGQLLVDVVDVIDFHLFHEQGLQKVQFKKGIIPLR